MPPRPPVELTVAFEAGSCALALTGADLAPIRFGFTVAANGAAPLAPAAAPDGATLLDGPAFAALPVAMRLGRALLVRGALSRRALRDLTEYSVAWPAFTHLTHPGAIAPVPVDADRVVDVPTAPLGDAALFAWDGGLAAAAMLARHRLGLAAGALRPAALVHVTGLESPAHDRAVAEAIAPAAAAEGIPLIRIAVDAASAGALEPICGRLPLVAAALHVAGGAHRIGLVARNWTYPMLVGRDRPRPHAPDMVSGGRFEVRTDGGGTSPAGQAALVARLPAIAAAIRPRTRRDIDLAALGFAAAGLDPPAAIRRRGAFAAALGIDLGDRIAEAAVGLILKSDPRGAAMTVLRARRAVARARTVAVDHARWAGALLGLREPWPR